MMEIQSLIIGLAIVGVVTHVTTSVMIMGWLDRHGVPTSFLLSRLLIFRYVNQYRRMTIAKTGKPGPLFYVYIVSINVALLGAIVLLIAL